MNHYITGSTIKTLREKGCRILSSSSLWQRPWGVSVIELMAGAQTENRSISRNLLRSKFYVCPLCGNILHTSGNAVVSCCGAWAGCTCTATATG